MQARPRDAIAAVMLVVIAAGGCTATRRPHSIEPLQASTSPPEADIPVPAGFRLEEQSSEDWSSGPLRYIRHVYSGRSEKHVVREFYREQMPLVRWSSVSENQVKGRHTLRFKRPNESCTITVTDSASGRAGNVDIEVLIAPAQVRGGA